MSLPSGLPAPALGGLSWGDVGSLIGPAFGIALIAFADTGVLSRVFAARHGERVDGSDEMRGLGLANAATGCGRKVRPIGRRARVTDGRSKRSRRRDSLAGKQTITCTGLAGP